MLPNQKKIYFVVGTSREAALTNPFLSVLKDSEVPVLVVSNQVDEIIF